MCPLLYFFFTEALLSSTSIQAMAALEYAEHLMSSKNVIHM